MPGCYFLVVKRLHRSQNKTPARVQEPPKAISEVSRTQKRNIDTEDASTLTVPTRADRKLTSLEKKLAKSNTATSHWRDECNISNDSWGEGFFQGGDLSHMWDPAPKRERRRGQQQGGPGPTLGGEEGVAQTHIGRGGGGRAAEHNARQHAFRRGASAAASCDDKRVSASSQHEQHGSVAAHLCRPKLFVHILHMLRACTSA